jgi:hypothetical protein
LPRSSPASESRLQDHATSVLRPTRTNKFSPSCFRVLKPTQTPQVFGGKHHCAELKQSAPDREFAPLPPPHLFNLSLLLTLHLLDGPVLEPPNSFVTTGWLMSGGIWVLSTTKGEATEKDTGVLFNANSMEERCRISEQLGGVLYADPKDCLSTSGLGVATGVCALRRIAVGGGGVDPHIGR